jgi:hypothetical protein
MRRDVLHRRLTDELTRLREGYVVGVLIGTHAGATHELRSKPRPATNW